MRLSGLRRGELGTPPFSWPVEGEARPRKKRSLRLSRLRYSPLIQTRSERSGGRRKLPITNYSPIA
jgi:hypothetical protein